MKQNTIIKYMNDCPIVHTTIGTLEIRDGTLYFENAIFDELPINTKKRIYQYMRD